MDGIDYWDGIALDYWVLVYVFISFEFFFTSTGGNHSANCMSMRKQHIEEEMVRSQGVIPLVD